MSKLRTTDQLQVKKQMKLIEGGNDPEATVVLNYAESIPVPETQKAIKKPEKPLKLTPDGKKLAIGAAGLLLAATGYGATRAVSAVEHAANAPTTVDKLHIAFEKAKANPEDVEPGKYVTFIASNGEGPIVIAQKVAKDGKFDAIMDDVTAQESANGQLDSGPILLEADAVDMQNPDVSKRITPFSGPSEQQ